MAASVLPSPFPPSEGNRMHKYLPLLVAILCGILAGGTVVSPWIGHLKGRIFGTQALVIQEAAPTNPHRSLSAAHFSRLLPSSAERPQTVQGSLMLTFYSPSGKTLSYLGTQEQTDLSLFVSIWNYTNQRQALGVIVLIDYNALTMQIDAREFTELYRINLQPNESIDIPMTLPTAGLKMGLHETTFIFVRQPDVYAVDDEDVAGVCCSIARVPLWVGPGDLPQQAVGTPNEKKPHSFGLIAPEMKRNSFETAAYEHFTLQAAVESSVSWKIVTLVDFTKAVATQTSPPGSYRTDLQIPALPPGKHEAISILFPEPFETWNPMEVEGRFLSQSAIRYTIFAP